MNYPRMTKKSNRTTNSIKNILTSMGGQLLSILLKFVVRTVFIHTLGKAYLGINGLFADILTMLSLTELGFDTAINYKLYKPLAEKDIKRIRILMKFYKQSYRMVGGAILFLGLCLIPFLPNLIRDYDSLAVLGINAVVIYLMYIFKSVSSYLFFAYRSAIIKADQKKYILDIADFVVTIIENILQIIMLVVFKKFLLYTASLIVFSILRNIVNAYIANKMYPEVFKQESESISKEEAFSMLKDCGALFVYRVNNVVAKATDNAVISAFIGLVSVGIYSNYLLFYTTVNGVLDKIYTSIKASMGNLFAVESINKKYSFFQTVNFLSFLLYGTAAVGIALCADEFIEAWVGKEYVIPDFFSMLIGAEILLHGLTNCLGHTRNVTGIFRQMWYRPILSAIINLIVSIILVQVIGIHGVIIGTISSSLFTNLAFDPIIIHKYGFNKYKSASAYYSRLLQYLVALAIIGFADYWLCSWILPSHGWLSVIVHGAIIVVDVPLFFLLLYRKTEECRYLIGKAKTIINKVISRKKIKNGGVA